MRPLVVFLLLLILPGCATSLEPMVKKIDTLEPGVVKTASVGGTMYEAGHIRAMPGFVASANYYLPEMDNLIYPTVKKGSVWVCNGKLKSGDYLCINPEISKKDVTTSTGLPLTSKLPLFIIKPWGEFHGLYYPDTARQSEQVNRLHGLFEYREIPLEDSYKARLVYGGKKDSTISISYQEFMGSLKEPSLSQVMTYEMTSANMINVKNVMIEVVEATETSVKYIVKH